ncbi:SDR family oxidoreductase [Rariglobus hedericola]|uniref:SDR family oxidoreductase n=1 Tax=Rariglobus hedericola TaxID=2597822 RepID=A0A556QME2_9BACT|nr:SDR family oxidoreductase [Rariglobus hedericola]TSJ77816.1 SDR family oxidoreductase [Rariglobus hedericola]
MKIIITGVTRGLGRALTEEFIRLGHTVMGCGRGSEGVFDLRMKYGAPHSFDVVDVSNATKVGMWGARVLGFGEVPDILINNAGLMNTPAPLWNVPAEEFATLVNVNITGTANVIREFVPAMVAAKKGVIVNLSSGWGRGVSPDVAPYCASKWAIEGLTKALAEELPSGMVAVPLNPGVIDTDMLRQCWGEGAGNYPKAEAWAKVASPFILKLSAADNGRSLTVPDFEG